MKTIILAGGLGTRLSEETAVRPKPMVEVGGHPMLWHIMNIYAAQGFKDFVVALGYKGEVVKDYFLNFRTRNSDLSLDLSTGAMTAHQGALIDWRVDLIDTGASTETGGRLKRAAQWIGGESEFFATYGDGVADIDLRKLLAFHRSHGKLATVTAVRPAARFGGLRLDGSQVVGFAEKPQAGEGWINGGFFVLDRRAMDYIDSDATIWERGPIERITADGQLMAYTHEGFWHPMDTVRERKILEDLWASGQAPWKLWS